MKQMAESKGKCREDEQAEFLAWMLMKIDERGLSEYTRKGHLTAWDAVRRFGGLRLFRDVTLERIEAFDRFLREERVFTATGKLVTRGQAAIHNYHKRLKCYVRMAFELGLIDSNPYVLFKDERGLCEGEPPLSRGQLEELLALREASVDEIECRYLDFFLFQLYTGLSYGDAKRFNYNRDVVVRGGVLFIQMCTGRNRREVSILLREEALMILKRYGFVLHISSNQKYNVYLKKIGLKLGGGVSLSSDVARNTYKVLFE